jgi:hypothetical protein
MKANCCEKLSGVKKWIPGSEKAAGMIKANSLPCCSIRMMDILTGFDWESVVDVV